MFSHNAARCATYSLYYWVWSVWCVILDPKTVFHKHRCFQRGVIRVFLVGVCFRHFAFQVIKTVDTHGLLRKYCMLLADLVYVTFVLRVVSCTWRNF